MLGEGVILLFVVVFFILCVCCCFPFFCVFFVCCCDSCFWCVSVGCFVFCFLGVFVVFVWFVELVWCFCFLVLFSMLPGKLWQIEIASHILIDLRHVQALTHHFDMPRL